jgi:ABC-type sugar transport system ATPase subunit
VKIISGAVQPDSGTIWCDGRPLRFDSVQSAQQRGIRVVHQVPALALELNVLDNVYLGSERVRRGHLVPLPWLDRRGMLAHLRPLLDRFAPDLDPFAVVQKLRAHERRLVGIIKALANDARVLILDEPTAALPSHERARLLETVQNLRNQGLAVLYVSHHLEEFEQLADEVVVLRDGRLVSHEIGRPNADHIVALMLGREPGAGRAAPLPEREVDGAAERFVFDVAPPHGTHRTTEVEEPVRFEITAGEIVLLTGLVGSGATEVAAAAFGAAPGWSASLTDRAGRHPIHSPHSAIVLGIGSLPEDRINQAVLPDLSIRANISISALGQLRGPLGRLKQSVERSRIREFSDALQIRHRDGEQLVTELSGGNQQKVMLARWLFTGSRLLILNEPTQGIDVIAKAEVRQILSAFAAQGGAVLIVSSDPGEFLALANRVLVMRRGRLAAELPARSLTAASVAEAILVTASNGGPQQ